MQSFVIKTNDSLPALEATLEDASGAVNLAGATVQFRLAATVQVEVDGCVTYKPGTVVFTKSATVVNAATGAVKYEWAAADTANAGYFVGEFVATFTGGKKQSFPTTGFIPVSINSSLS